MTAATAAEKINTHDRRFYKTTLNALANSWHESRELWKSKYMEIKAETKKYKDELKNVIESRDVYKQKIKNVQQDFYEIKYQMKKKNEREAEIKSELELQKSKAKELLEVINNKNTQIEFLNQELEKTKICSKSFQTSTPQCNDDEISNPGLKKKKNLEGISIHQR